MLVKIIMNGVYRKKLRKDIEEKFACKSECWMTSDYDRKVKEYWKISYGNCFVKMADDVGW